MTLNMKLSGMPQTDDQIAQERLIQMETNTKKSCALLLLDFINSVVV